MPVNIIGELDSLSKVVDTELKKGTSANFDKMCEAIFQILGYLSRLSYKNDQTHQREVSKEVTLNIKEQVKLKGGVFQWCTTVASVGVQGVATIMAFIPAVSVAASPLSYFGQSIDKISSTHNEENGKSIHFQHLKDEMNRMQNDQREAMQRSVGRITEFMQAHRQLEGARHEASRAAASAA